MNRKRLLLCAAALTVAAAVTVSCGGELRYHTITITSDGNGVAVANEEKALQGSAITVLATSDEGYAFGRWSIVGGNAVLENATLNPVTFSMPAEDVEIMADFVEEKVEMNGFDFIHDQSFRKHCEAFDTDGDGVLSQQEIDLVTIIDVNNWYDEHISIKSLAGIEIFTNLTRLECSYNSITEMDLSKNIELTTLWCAQNGIEALELSKNTALGELICSGNNLTALDVSGNSAIKLIICSDNRLKTLNIDKKIDLSALEYINCARNNMGPDTLNTIFNALPVVKGSIDIQDNPGTDTCDTSIAVQKKWTVMSN
jgi:hypothetical protein